MTTEIKILDVATTQMATIHVESEKQLSLECGDQIEITTPEEVIIKGVVLDYYQEISGMSCFPVTTHKCKLNQIN